MNTAKLLFDRGLEVNRFLSILVSKYDNTPLFGRRLFRRPTSYNKINEKVRGENKDDCILGKKNESKKKLKEKKKKSLRNKFFRTICSVKQRRKRRRVLELRTGQRRNLIFFDSDFDTQTFQRITDDTNRILADVSVKLDEPSTVVARFPSHQWFTKRFHMVHKMPLFDPSVSFNFYSFSRFFLNSATECEQKKNKCVIQFVGRRLVSVPCHSVMKQRKNLYRALVSGNSELSSFLDNSSSNTVVTDMTHFMFFQFLRANKSEETTDVTQRRLPSRSDDFFFIQTLLATELGIVWRNGEKKNNFVKGAYTTFVDSGSYCSYDTGVLNKKKKEHVDDSLCFDRSCAKEKVCMDVLLLRQSIGNYRKDDGGYVPNMDENSEIGNVVILFVVPNAIIIYKDLFQLALKLRKWHIACVSSWCKQPSILHLLSLEQENGNAVCLERGEPVVTNISMYQFLNRKNVMMKNIEARKEINVKDNVSVSPLDLIPSEINELTNVICPDLTTCLKVRSQSNVIITDTLESTRDCDGEHELTMGFVLVMTTVKVIKDCSIGENKKESLESIVYATDEQHFRFAKKQFLVFTKSTCIFCSGVTEFYTVLRQLLISIGNLSNYPLFFVDGKVLGFSVDSEKEINTEKTLADTDYHENSLFLPITVKHLALKMHHEFNSSIQPVENILESSQFINKGILEKAFFIEPKFYCQIENKCPYYRYQLCAWYSWPKLLAATLVAGKRIREGTTESNLQLALKYMCTIYNQINTWGPSPSMSLEGYIQYAGTHTLTLSHRGWKEKVRIGSVVYVVAANVFRSVGTQLHERQQGENDSSFVVHNKKSDIDLRFLEQKRVDVCFLIAIGYVTNITIVELRSAVAVTVILGKNIRKKDVGTNDFSTSNAETFLISAAPPPLVGQVRKIGEEQIVVVNSSALEEHYYKIDSFKNLRL